MKVTNRAGGLAVLGLCISITACQQQSGDAGDENMAKPMAGGDAAQSTSAGEHYEVSYLTGYQIGQNLKGAGLEIDIDTLSSAITDGMQGKDSALTDEQQQTAIATQRAARQASIEKARQERAAVAETTKAEGEAFLAENAQREGVTVTESGLQYEVITMGDGPKPAREDKVRVHYAGTLIDDTPFDSSYQRGEPIDFQLTNVIAGWTEGVQLMPVGSKFKFFVPSDLAYGPQDRGAVIKANSTLVFEVELLDIVEPEQASDG